MKSSGTAGRRPRGAPRGSGRGGFRGGRGGYRRYNSDDAHSAPNGDYHDYPSDFTTLFPVSTEFVMPYVSQTFYPVTFAPPPSAVVDDGQVKTAYVPVSEEIIIDMVKKQV